jgi:hypothetical protein
MLIYDRDLFQEYRAKAITDVKDLVIGKTYYSNFEFPFTLIGISYLESPSSPELGLSKNPKWMLKHTPDSDGFVELGGYNSLHDNNIGMSYNPWLIFESEELANECKQNLKITFERDGWDDWDSWDDYDDDTL